MDLKKMEADCVRVLVFIESVIVKKKGDICELMMVSMDSRRNISAF